MKGVDRSIYPYGMEVPCGKCFQCRIKYRKQWAMRLLHESEFWDKSVFVTLTYNDDNLPHGGTLEKEDLKKFFKRLRKYTKRNLKYYACGEYGDDNFRPHYHSIIFGFSNCVEDRELIKDCWKLCTWSTQYKAFGEVTPESIEYVTGYIDKKLSGPLLEQFKKEHEGKAPIFKLSSQGLGERYCLKYADKIKQNQSIQHRGVDLTIPRYYINKLGIDVTSIREKSLMDEIDTVQKITGLSYSRDEIYTKFYNESDKMLMLERTLKQSKIQSEKNLKARSDLYNQRKPL